jgi:hypothetical protein
MWIFTKYGFFSIVANGDDFVVRARSKMHLENLRRRFEDLKACPVDEKSATDYPCRIYVQRKTWLEVVRRLTGEVDYTNFKKEVGTKDAMYSRAVAAVWAIMARMEQRFR